MTFEEYQKGVRETWNNNIPWHDQFNNAVFGLLGELGEFIEMYKKHFYHDKPLDNSKEVNELGDILYYLTILIDVVGYNLESIAIENNRKLSKRYPNGFVTGGGIRKEKE